MVESDAHCHQFCWSMDEGGISIHKLQHHCVCVHNRTGTICVEAQLCMYFKSIYTMVMYCSHAFTYNLHEWHSERKKDKVTQHNTTRHDTTRHDTVLVSFYSVHRGHSSTGSTGGGHCVPHLRHCFGFSPEESGSAPRPRPHPPAANTAGVPGLCGSNDVRCGASNEG